METLNTNRLVIISAKNRALFNISVARVMALNDEFEQEQKKAEKRSAKQAKIDTKNSSFSILNNATFSSRKKTI